MASPLSNQSVLVLGGGGYIGSHFRKMFSGEKFIYHSHANVLPKGEKFYERVNTVLNLSSSKLNAAKDESRSANFDFPLAILKYLSKRPLKWVQASSYYELQVPLGRTDYYSSDKLSFRNYLNGLTLEEEEFTVTSLILPHVFGGTELESRIMPTLKRMNDGDEIVLGSRHQLIPILHVTDAVRALREAISTRQTICTPQPMWHGQLGELVLQLANSRGTLNRVFFKETSEKYQEATLRYPEELENFLPELNMKQFVQLFKDGEFE